MYTTKSNFKSSNYEVCQSISWEMLSKNQCEEIYSMAAELLERTGAQVASKKALDVFKKGGCWVDGDIVRIPSAKLDWAIRTAPSRITICDADGKRALQLENEHVHYGLGGGAEEIVDRKTGEPRAIELKDIEDAARIADKLEYVSFVTYPGVPTDVKGKGAVLHAIEAVMKHTKKPLLLPVCCEKCAETITDLAAAAAGGLENLQRNPNVVLSINCDEPRYHSEDAMESVIFAAKNHIPFVYNNVLVSGETAPATTAGTLVLAAANTFIALVLSQLVFEGAPFIAGGRFTIVDAENGMKPYGAPEVSLISAGFANFMKEYKLPTFILGGVSDSAVSDAQSGAESVIGLLTSALSGANLFSGGGMLESGKQYSHTFFAISDEAMGMVFRIMNGFEINEDTLACGVYDIVKPGGAYLGEEHTNLYFKSEQFWPNLFNRKRIKDWLADGGKSLGERASDYVEQILTQPESPVLDAEKAEKISKFVAAAEKKL